MALISEGRILGRAQYVLSVSLFQERLDLGVGTAEVENQCAFLALENQTQIKTTAACGEATERG